MVKVIESPFLENAIPDSAVAHLFYTTDDKARSTIQAFSFAIDPTYRTGVAGHASLRGTSVRLQLDGCDVGVFLVAFSDSGCDVHGHCADGSEGLACRW